MLRVEELQQYFYSDMSEMTTYDLAGLQDLIFSDVNFKANLGILLGEVSAAFDYVVKHAQFLSPFLQRYQQNTSIDIVSSYSKKENDAFRIAIRNYLRQDEEFQTLDSLQELGLVLFDNQSLKEKIKNCALHCLLEIQVTLGARA